MVYKKRKENIIPFDELLILIYGICLLCAMAFFTGNRKIVFVFSFFFLIFLVSDKLISYVWAIISWFTLLWKIHTVFSISLSLSLKFTMIVNLWTTETALFLEWIRAKRWTMNNQIQNFWCRSSRTFNGAATIETESLFSIINANDRKFRRIKSRLYPIEICGRKKHTKKKRKLLARSCSN